MKIVFFLLFLAVDGVHVASREEGENPEEVTLTKLLSKPDLFLEHCVRNFPTLLPWEVAVTCGVDQWDSVLESHDHSVKSRDLTDQSATSHYLLYAVYINKLFTAAKGNPRLSGRLSAMLRSDPSLLLNTLAVLLQLDSHVGALSDSSTPR